jgi:hypothetical protein
MIQQLYPINEADQKAWRHLQQAFGHIQSDRHATDLSVQQGNREWYCFSSWMLDGARLASWHISEYTSATRPSDCRGLDGSIFSGIAVSNFTIECDAGYICLTHDCLNMCGSNGDVRKR